MNGRYLLDTNIVIALFAKDKKVLDELSKASEIFIPSFVNSNTILPCDSETSHMYGQIKSDMKVKGKPIPGNDIWISVKLPRSFGHREKVVY